MNPQELKKRNRKIIKARLNGVTGAHLGRKYGLSRQLICKVYRAYMKSTQK